jgi:hypothetical protein
MKKQIKLASLFCLMLWCLPNAATAQFVNYGVLASGGVGGLKGAGLSTQTNLNPEIGIVFKYNWSEQISYLNIVSVGFHKTTFMEGKQLKEGSNSKIVEVAPDRSLNTVAFSYHLLMSYHLLEDKLDVSFGGYAAFEFQPSPDVTNRPDAYYGATNAEVLSGEGFTFNHIEAALSRATIYGLSAAVTGGTTKFKGMVRYDYGLNNLYVEDGSANKLKQRFLKVGLIYFFK